MHDRDRCCREAWPRKKTTATITATRTKSTPYVDTPGPRAGGVSFSLQRNYIDRVTNNDPISDAELDEMQRRADAGSKDRGTRSSKVPMTQDRAASSFVTWTTSFI